MEAVKDLKVIAADRMDGSVVISFSDGRCGLYSADLLDAMFPKARKLHEPEDVSAKEYESV